MQEVCGTAVSLTNCVRGACYAQAGDVKAECTCRAVSPMHLHSRTRSHSRGLGRDRKAGVCLRELGDRVELGAQVPQFPRHQWSLLR